MVRLGHNNVGKTTINHPFGSGFYNRCLGDFGDCLWHCFTHIVAYHHRGWDWCPCLGICFTSPEQISVGDEISPFFVGWCEQLGHRNQPL